MTITVGAFEAKTHLSALLERVERGEEIVITRHGRPVARLAPVGVSPRDALAAAERLRELSRGLTLGGAVADETPARDHREGEGRA